MDDLKIKLIAKYQCGLGEAPFFDIRNNAFYQVDCFKKMIIKITFKDTEGFPQSKIDLLEDPNKTIQECSVIRSIQERAFEDVPTLVIPVEEDENLMLISLGKKLAIFDFDNNKILDQVDYTNTLKDLERFNDGKCDAMGRLIIGTMYCDGNDENVQNLSSLYRLEGRNLIQIETNFNVTNGFAWTKDAKNFFINDSGDRVIYQYDYDINLGEVKNKRILIDFNKTPLDGCSLNSLESPDGCIIDGEDKLWVALWDGSRIVNLDPVSCKVLHSISIGSSKTTSLCNGKLFGKDALFVTSAFSESDSNRRLSGRSFVIFSKTKNFVNSESNYFKHSSFA